MLILDLGTRSGKWSVSRSGRALAQGKGPPGTLCTGDWVGLRTGLDTEATEKKILSPLPGIEPRSHCCPARSQTLLVDRLWWGEDDVSELCLYGHIVHPRMIALWIMVWWYRLGLNPNSSTRALWQPPVVSGGPMNRDISGASRGMDEGIDNLVCSSPWDFKIYLTCSKILLHGTSGFTYHPKEGVMRMFIAPKIHLLGRVRTRGPLCPVCKHTIHYTTRLLARHYTDWATRLTTMCTTFFNSQ
jgi:hypothetical protein